MAKTKAKAKPEPKVPHGTMRVWHVPQVPCPSFKATVTTLREARLVMNVLANYDAFQFKNRIKPDYSNAAGLQIWDDTLEEDKEGEKWCDWYDGDGREFNDIPDDELDVVKWEGAR